MEGSVSTLCVSVPIEGLEIPACLANKRVGSSGDEKPPGSSWTIGGGEWPGWI